MATLFLTFTLAAAADAYPNAHLLLEPADLAKRPRAVHVLDVRGKNAYDKGHVPGSVWVDATAWGRAFNAEPTAAAWAKRLVAAGIAPAAPVAVLGDDRVNEAARVWWILKYWGCKDVKLMNGGWAGYVAASGPVSTEPVAPPSAAVTLTPAAGRLATKDQLLNALKAAPPQLVDTRSRAEFCGTAATAKRNGAMPGAVHLEWTETLDPTTKRFKTAEELAALFRERHIDVGRPAVTYCQSGGRASVVAFALELMGGRQVGNYYKSWAEWGNDPATPVVAPPKP